MLSFGAVVGRRRQNNPWFAAKLRVARGFLARQVSDRIAERMPDIAKSWRLVNDKTNPELAPLGG